MLLFSKLKQCPFCGHDEYYTTEYVYGTIRYAERFDGKEANNAELYDGLNVRSSKGSIYCRHCCKYLGNRITNKTSKQVQKAFSKKGDTK